MLLIVEKRKYETDARIKEVSVRATTNEAAISELGDNINRSRLAYNNVNSRIDDIDAQQKLTSHLHSSIEWAARTHCNVWNIAPSISASIGNFAPKKYVWKVS